MKTWKSRELVRHLERKYGATILRQKGSHLRITVTGPDGTTCPTTIPMHSKDLTQSTLRNIERQLAPALDEGWLRSEG